MSFSQRLRLLLAIVESVEPPNEDFLEVLEHLQVQSLQ